MNSNDSLVSLIAWLLGSVFFGLGHGVLNGFAFVLCGLVGWLFLERFLFYIHPGLTPPACACTEGDDTDGC